MNLNRQLAKFAELTCGECGENAPQTSISADKARFSLEVVCGGCGARIVHDEGEVDREFPYYIDYANPSKRKFHYHNHIGWVAFNGYLDAIGNVIDKFEGVSEEEKSFVMDVVKKAAANEFLGIGHIVNGDEV